MKRERVYYETGAYGLKTEKSTRPEKWLATPYPLGMLPAGNAAVRRARQIVPEGNEADFVFDGNGDAVDKATGAAYRRVTCDAFNTDVEQSGAVVFVQRGGWILFLKPHDFRPPVRTVVMATALVTAVIPGAPIQDADHTDIY